MKVLVNSSDVSGCGNYRICEPYYEIKSDIEFHVNTTGKIKPQEVKEYDAVVFQRPTEKELIPFIKELKEEGKIVVIEIDDDLSSIEKNNPAYVYYNQNNGEKLKVFEELINSADHIHVSTPQLKNRINHPSVHVFLNAINLKKYAGKTNNEETAIMWSGSTHHSDSLLIIAPVIKELVRKKIKVILNSSVAWLNLLGFKESEYLKLIDWSDIKEFHNIQSQAYISLTPLIDNAFNRSKSELKILEFAAWGIPSVSSNVIPYQRFNRLTNGNVLVKSNKQKHWMEAVEQLLENKEFYREKSENCIHAIKTIYNLRTVNEERNNFWESVLIKNFIKELAN